MDAEKNKIKKDERLLYLKSDNDIVKIREYGRNLAAHLGFSENDQAFIATAISEICRNVVEYADCGEVKITIGEPNEIVILVKDQGPGIKDLKKAMEEGYSTGEGLGIGLPGAKRIMDSFDIQTGPAGTIVKMSKCISNKNIL